MIIQFFSQFIQIVYNIYTVIFIFLLGGMQYINTIINS